MTRVADPEPADDPRAGSLASSRGVRPPTPRPRRALWLVLGPAARAFDAVSRAWGRPGTQHGLGLGLVIAFVGALAAVELARRGWLPAGAGARVPRTHFWAVDVVFTLLLVLELVALVLALARSVTASVGHQFELLALILLRKAFLEVAHVGEPVTWGGAAAHVPVALADMAAALVVFVLAEVHARTQPHRAIASGDDQDMFVAAKKLVALGLLVALGAGIAAAVPVTLSGGRPAFFGVAFTVLIFTDVLLVLLSLAVSADSRVVFRNSAYAAATVMIRLALTAPPYVNALLAVGAVAYAVLVGVAYARAGGTPVLAATPQRGR